MRNDIEEISAALGLSPQALITCVCAVMALMFAAVGTGDDVICVASAVGGCGVIAIGVRAALRPSRRFPRGRLEMSGAPGVTTTRRLGLFYVLVGVICVMISLVARRADPLVLSVLTSGPRAVS